MANYCKRKPIILITIKSIISNYGSINLQFNKTHLQSSNDLRGQKWLKIVQCTGDNVGMAEQEVSRPRVKYHPTSPLCSQIARSEQ